MINIIDSEEASQCFKKRLRRVNDKNISQYSILSKIENVIIGDYVGRKIATELRTNSLIISTEKKKNAALNLIKDGIDDIVLNYIDRNDLDLLFNIRILDNSVIVESKRIIEQ